MEATTLSLNAKNGAHNQYHTEEAIVCIILVCLFLKLTGMKLRGTASQNIFQLNKLLRIKVIG